MPCAVRPLARLSLTARVPLPTLSPQPLSLTPHTMNKLIAVAAFAGVANAYVSPACMPHAAAMRAPVTSMDETIIQNALAGDLEAEGAENVFLTEVRPLCTRHPDPPSPPPPLTPPFLTPPCPPFLDPGWMGILPRQGGQVEL